MQISEYWKIPVVENYSCNEVGYIAIQCREYGSLHIQSESLLVEILNHQGEPCASGETGRIVITSLNNPVMPLIRYELGDLVTAGSPCSCGRHLPTIQKINGRVRNLAVTPDGQKFWPSGLGAIRKIESVIQAQYVQKSADTIKLNLRLKSELSEDDKSELIKRVHKSLGHPYKIIFHPVEEISRGPGGKFEEFISEL